MTLGQLAEALNTSLQNLSNKLARNNFSEKELIEIAKVLDCEYESVFTLKNGEKI